MKKILYFSLLSAVLSCVLVSCQFIESQHNHKYSRTWTTTESEHWRQASCEHTDLIVNQGEHTFDEGMTTKSPTEEEEGVFTYTCTVCKYTKTQVIARLPHTHKFDTDEWTFNDICHWKNATCEHTMESTTPEDHTDFMVNNVCSVCNYMAESEGLAFVELSDGTYELAGRGSNTDKYIVIPETYEGKPVTSIGSDAFNDSFKTIGVLKIVIPASVTNIGERAFYNCKGFEEVIYEGESNLTTIGDYAFYNCEEAFTAFTIPKTVTHIGEGAFMSCKVLSTLTIEDGNRNFKIVDGHLYSADETKLIQYALGTTSTEFTVPDSVTELGVGVFAYSPHLEKVVFNIDSSLTTISNDAFHYSLKIKEIQIPNGVTVLGERVFSYCQDLTTLNIPENLVTIGDMAFNYCTDLPEFIIPSTVKTIGDSAFAHCKLFTRFDIPDGVTHLGTRAMAGCTELVEVTIPKSVTRYGTELFYGSSKLQNVTVDPENTVLQSIDGNLYTKDGKTFIHYCKAKEATEITLPDTVTRIEDSAFYFCSNLKTVTLPAGLKTIGKDAFMLCENLVSVNLPEGITSIGESAFYECKSLSAITIPTTMTTLSEEVFCRCSSLTYVFVPANITTIEKSALAQLNSSAEVEFEIVEGWSRYYTLEGKNYVEAIPSEEISDPKSAVNFIAKTRSSIWKRS